MPFFSGFAGQFGKDLASSRSEEADRAERQSQLEAGILQHLASSTDPEIASHAITGLLDLAGPQKRAGGLSGWLGKVAAHPALPTIRQLVSQGRQVEDQPPQAPRLNVEAGLQSLPGTPVDSPRGALPQGIDAPPSSPMRPQPIGPPAPDATERAALAATPPPSAPLASGYKPATSKTVPRKLFDTPNDVEARKVSTAGKTTRAELDAKVAAFDAASPEARQGVFGHQTPITRTTDKDGNVHFFQGATEVGEAVGAGQPKTPPAGESAEHQQAVNLLAANPGLTPEQALQQVRQNAEAARVAKVTAAADAHTVRLGQIQIMVPNTIAAWQKVNGTTPMTKAQALGAANAALNTARGTLGFEATPEDIETFARGLMVASDTQARPAVSHTRAGLTQPLGGAPAATPPPSAGPNFPAVPEHLQGQAIRPKTVPAQIQMQRSNASKVLAINKRVQGELDAIDQMGLLGPIGGRWGAFMAGGVGTLGGSYTPEQAELLSRFRTDMGFLKSGTMMVHGGQRGAGSQAMMERADKLISADKMDAALLRGALSSFNDVLSGYAAGAPETPATKPGGPPATASPFSVTTGDGEVHPFDTQAKADAFKALVLSKGGIIR